MRWSLLLSRITEFAGKAAREELVVVVVLCGEAERVVLVAGAADAGTKVAAVAA